MPKQLRLFAVLAVAVSLEVASSSSTAVGQELVKARGGSGNISSTELRNIYREDVGTGYTSQSLNQLSLQNARAQVGNVGQASLNSQSGPRVQSLAGGTTSKPFSSVSNSPAVSPYLNLFREDFEGGGDFNYQTLVRPQFQQLATNQQFQRQNTELSQRVQAISAQSAFKNPAGSEQQYPTGHQTAFGYYGSFYPGMAQQKRGR